MTRKSAIIGCAVICIALLVGLIFFTGVTPYDRGPLRTLKAELRTSEVRFRDRVPDADSDQPDSFRWLSSRSRARVLADIKTLKSRDRTFRLVTDKRLVGRSLPDKSDVLDAFLIRQDNVWRNLGTGQVADQQ